MLRSLVLLASLSLASFAIKAESLDPNAIERIDADVRAILARTNTPSAAIAVVRDGNVVYRKAYGYRDVERRLPAEADTFYEIGSITKQFTAAAILTLQEAGKLRIDDKLSKYLPDAPHADEVTLRQLLSHTSGLPEYFVDGPETERVATKPVTFDELLARVAGKPLDFSPGSRMTYNNTGYILLGRVIEVVSRQSYRDYVRKHLIEPAGMAHTHTVAEEAGLSNMAIGYRHNGSALERAPTIHESFGWSAGNLVSTLDDLEKWNRALAGGRIVSAASYAEMTTPVAITQGSSDYGLGLFVDSVHDQPRIGHTGGTFGFTTANELFPKQRLRIIAFTNCRTDPEPGEMITTAIFDDVFPDIAAAANRSAPGEDADVTLKATTLFEHLQSGAEDSHLVARLDAKMKSGLAGRLKDLFAPFGAPTRFIYKGSRQDAGLHWYDYVIDFGPGSQLKFAIGLDDEAKIASLSYG